jgi:lycopene cyclase domain-containing protein
VTRYLYLLTILASAAGVLAIDRRISAGIAGRRLLRTILSTVPIFLAFDLLGAARGWFSSDPRLNTAIVPPGIPLEEPILLAFLTLVSISLWWGARRLVE